MSLVLCQLQKLNRNLEQHVASVSQQFQLLNQRLADIDQKLCKPGSSTEMAHAEVSVAVQQLTEKQRRLLRRCPVVTNDEQWAELEATLVDSGHDGLFFSAFVQTMKDRILDRSDVHKAANATLRSLVAEPYLAERVTMAGYKKCKI